MAIQVAIEGYDSLEQIGLGGMAAVYRARQISIDKTVAIKVLFPYLATDESFIDRFQREAKAAASIQHENIVNVIDFGESDGAFYIVMEYYDGRTLEQLMKERPGLPPEIAIQVLLEVAYGLEAAHALNIVHRDIKPANLIYTNQGGIKIADFGLARKSDSMTMITHHGKVIGTPAYMSPEQAAGNPVGPASDIFSFGVVAYELLGRRRPFEGQTYSEVFEKIQSHNPPPLTLSNPLIAPEFEQVVARALAKNESDRYASASELIAALEAAMDKNQIARDRRRLASYAKDPAHYENAHAEQAVAQCLSRGAFFMQKGTSHLNDAVLEFRRVLFLSPEHERARENLAKLQSEQKIGPGTRVMDATMRPSEATRMLPAARPVPAPAPAARRRVPTWVYGAAVVAVIGGSAAVGMMRTERGSSETTTQTAARAGQVDSTPLQRVIVDTDSLPAAARETTMSASTLDRAVVPLADARDTQKKEPAVVPAVTKPKDKVPSTDKSAEKPVPAPVPGSLSVYFLGGVGELWVDGKMFARQPPFEKAEIASGAHRVMCRMNGDGAGREINVTIRPGRETVIEYETGATPVVVEE